MNMQASLIGLLVLPVLMVTSASLGSTADNAGELLSSGLLSPGSKQSSIPIPGGPQKPKEFFMGLDELWGGLMTVAKNIKTEDIAKSIDAVHQAGKVLKSGTDAVNSFATPNNPNGGILNGLQTLFDAPARALLLLNGDSTVLTKGGTGGTGDVVLDVLQVVNSVSNATLNLIDNFKTELCTLVNVLFLNGSGPSCDGDMMTPDASDETAATNDSADDSTTEASTTEASTTE